MYVPSQPSWNHRTKPQTSAATDAVAARSTEDDVTRTRAQESGLEAARHSLSDLEEGALAEHHAGGLIGGAKLTPLERERPTYLGRGAERSSGAGQGGASGTSAGRGLFRSKSGVPVPLAKQDSLGRANGTEPERRDGRVSEAESDEEPLGDLEGGRSGVVIRGLGPIEDSGLRGGFARNGRYHHKMGGSFGKPDRRRSVDSQSLGSTVTKRVSDVGRHVGGGKGATLLSKDWAVNENETGDERREAKGEGLRFETEGLREEGKGLDVGKKLEKQPRGGQDGLGQANGELGGENWHKEENAGEGLEGGSGRQSSQETRIGRRNSVALSGEGFRSGVVYASPDPVKTESFNKVREWFSRGDHGERADFSAAKRNGAEQHSTERNGVARSGMERKRTELRRAGIDVKGGEGGSRRQVAFESKESERREVRSGNGIGRYSVQQTEQNPPEAEYWETESLLFGKRPPRWDTSPYKAAHVAQVSETRNESRARELSTTRATFSNDKPTGPGGSLRGRSGDTWQATRGGGDLVRARERVAEELEAGGWSPDRADVEMVDCLLFDLPEMVASVQNFRSQLE